MSRLIRPVVLDPKNCVEDEEENNVCFEHIPHISVMTYSVGKSSKEIVFKV